MKSENVWSYRLSDIVDEIRPAISNAYYDARNAGETMEDAASRAAGAVLMLLQDSQALRAPLDEMVELLNSLGIAGPNIPHRIETPDDRAWKTSAMAVARVVSRPDTEWCVCGRIWPCKAKRLGDLVTAPVPMTIKEAAAQLGVTPDTLRQAIARGSLKADKRGTRDWLVSQAEVDRYRREHRRAAASAAMKDPR